MAGPLDPRKGDLRHVREQGLVRTIPIDGRRDVAVVLTDRGRQLLESHRRDRDGRCSGRGRGLRDSRQEFYADLKKPRELEHDPQVYPAYEREAAKLQERGARIERVVLDYELKREYQQFLQERNRGRADSDGRPDRDESEIQEWAYEHDLPYFDGHVHFPDARIEYVDADGRLDHLDVEVVTIHYRGADGAAASRSGFSTFRGSGAGTRWRTGVGATADASTTSITSHSTGPSSRPTAATADRYRQPGSSKVWCSWTRSLPAPRLSGWRPRRRNRCTCPAWLASAWR